MGADVSVKLASPSASFQMIKLKAEPLAATESESLSFVPIIVRRKYFFHIRFAYTFAYTLTSARLG
jgi:hypothetical protein